jgi:hypothetical protein
VKQLLTFLISFNFIDLGLFSQTTPIFGYETKIQTEGFLFEVQLFNDKENFSKSFYTSSILAIIVLV